MKLFSSFYSWEHQSSNLLSKLSNIIQSVLITAYLEPKQYGLRIPSTIILSHGFCKYNYATN